MSYTSTLVLLLHLIYLSYLSNVYSACSYFTNLDLFCTDNARVIYRKISNVYSACSFFTNLDCQQSKLFMNTHVYADLLEEFNEHLR